MPPKQFMYVCARCGAEYPVTYVTEWGANGHGDGYGPAPCCSALRGDPLVGQFVCKGELAPTAP